MSLRQLPRPQAFQRPNGFSAEMPSQALESWAAHPAAAAVTDGNVIEINDVIGEDWWTGGGFTSNRMSAALRSIGAKDVTVTVNSPGGDMFEGLAIYNMLAEHPAKVTVQVMGLAASAASLIAMAGDDIVMARGSFMMIHNAWGLVVGNRHDMEDGRNVFSKFDAAMADIYAARTGIPAAEVSAMMDGDARNADGTWLTAQEAVDKKFADRLTDAPQGASARAEADPTQAARRRVDAILADKGLPRTERRALFREMRGTPGAARQPVMPGADIDTGAIERLIQTIKG